MVHPNTGKDVLPRFSAGPIAVPFVGPVVLRPSEHDEPSAQPAFAIPTWVDVDVVAALQIDFEGSFSFAFHFIQNKFSGLDSTVRGSDEMVPTEVDSSGVDVWGRRLVLIPQVGAHGSVQDRQSDEFQDTGIHTQVGSVKPPIGDSDTKSVFQSTPDKSGDENIAKVPETVVTRATQAAFLSLDSVDLTVMFKTRANVMRSPPKFLRGAYKSAIRGFLRVGSWGSRPERSTEVQSMEVVRLVAQNALIQPPRGGLVAKSKMVERFKFFSDGRWEDLLLLSRDSAMVMVQALGQRRREIPRRPCCSR